MPEERLGPTDEATSKLPGSLIEQELKHKHDEARSVLFANSELKWSQPVGHDFAASRDLCIR